MADLTVDNINNILTSVVDKYTEKDIVSSNAINSIEFDGDKVEITVELNYPAKGYHNELSQNIILPKALTMLMLLLKQKSLSTLLKRVLKFYLKLKILLQLLQAKVALVNQLHRLT